MNLNVNHCRKSLFGHLERRRQLFPRFYFLSMEDVMHIVCNGYDLTQVNLYINKLFANMGMLVFKDLEEGERSVSHIVAIKSSLGEKLPLKEVGSVCKCRYTVLHALRQYLSTGDTVVYLILYCKCSLHKYSCLFLALPSATVDWLLATAGEV